MADEETKRVHENTSSSYLSLKAELLRKKQDLNKPTSSSFSGPSSSLILDNLHSSSSSLRLKVKADLDIEIARPKKKRQQTTEDEKRSPSPPTSNLSREEEIALAKSRAILEAKSKLYDEIMSNGDRRVLAEDDGDEDNDKSFLVDFERKIFETNIQPPKLEYTDSFGRTRLVTPDEYERLKSEEQKQQFSSPEKRSSNNVEQEIERVERLHREKMRSKWEAEMEELRNKTHVHYQDLLFDEKRDHGVGYYQFSTDDQRRAEQMEMLNQLRSQTKTEQMKFQQDQNQRQSAMSDRLTKFRLRKAKELGVQLDVEEKPIEPSPPVVTKEAPIESSISTVMKNDAPIESSISTVTKREAPASIEQKPSTSTSNIVRTAPTTNSNMAYPFPVLRPAKGSDSSSSRS